MSVLVLFRNLGEAISRWLAILLGHAGLTHTEPVDPSEPEACEAGLEPDYLLIPDEFKMCQGHRWLHEGIREWDCDLLIEPLRRLAATKNPRHILETAAEAKKGISRGNGKVRNSGGRETSSRKAW